MTVSEMKSLFSPAVRDLPKFMILAEAVLQQIVDLQTVISEIPAAFSLNSAVGVQLDILGSNYNIARSTVAGGRTDSTYRDYLRSKLALWRWDGTNGSALAALAECYPDGGVSVNDEGDGWVSVRTRNVSYLRNLYERIPAPAGIEKRLVSG